MLIIFKPCGATQADAPLTLKIEKLLQENPQATVLKVRTDISDRAVPFIHTPPKVQKGEELVIAGQGCLHVLVANLFSLWDKDIVFKIKKDYFGLPQHNPSQMQRVIEGFFGKSIWED